MSDYIYIKIKIKYVIKNNEHYVFGVDNNLYNLRTNRKIKQVRNGGSIGYIISNKFYSCTYLKENKMLIKPPKIEMPF